MIKAKNLYLLTVVLVSMLPALGVCNTPLHYDVPDGDYLVTAVIGGKEAGETTLRVESRRSYIENLRTEAGKTVKVQFLVHKRSPRIDERQSVKIKQYERTKLDWDNKLTFEVLGSKPMLASLNIEPAPRKHTTVFLCGNSTVVNQDEEPWASWGQMIPRFFDKRVCIANYAESGESVVSFRASLRWAKVLSLVRPGDYVFIEFGHNDEKIKDGEITSLELFYQGMRSFVEEAQQRGARVVLLTPTERRLWAADGTLQRSHGEYPATTIRVASDTRVPLIPLTEMTRTMYQAWGQETSKRALVHYPANTFEGQTKALADNTHFNPFGAYEVAQCVLQGIKDNVPALRRNLQDFKGFDPNKPDDPDKFLWVPSNALSLMKPEGN